MYASNGYAMPCHGEGDDASIGREGDVLRSTDGVQSSMPRVQTQSMGGRAHLSVVQRAQLHRGPYKRIRTLLRIRR